MSRSRLLVLLCFWLALLFTLALQVLNEETAGGRMSVDGPVRHLVLMALLLIPLARLVYERARDAGLDTVTSLVAVPVTVLFMPFSLIALLALPSAPPPGRASRPLPWWLAPLALGAGVGLGLLVSMMLSI